MAINEFERVNLLERQRGGIEIAKRQGKFKGRKAIIIDPEIFAAQYNRYLQREISKSEMARALDVSRPTLEKLIKTNNRSGEFLTA